MATVEATSVAANLFFIRFIIFVITLREFCEKKRINRKKTKNFLIWHIFCHLAAPPETNFFFMVALKVSDESSP